MNVVAVPAVSSQLEAAMLPCWTFSALPTQRSNPTRSTCITPHRRPRHTPWTCSTSENGGKRRPRRSPKKEKAGAFANAIDDLTMKKYGRGYIYYGERKRLDDNAEVEEEQDESDTELLKPDPVLVVGGTGRTGQWITLGLLNQGFNVRVLTREFERAEKIFGPSGDNVDVFEGALDNPEALYEAVDGAAAVVFAAAAPWWIPGGVQTVYSTGASALVAAAKKASSVRRFVLISAADANGASGRAKRVAEDALRDSGLAFVVIRPVKLVDEDGGFRRIRMDHPFAADGVESDSGRGQLSRVDLAQVVCQVLVHDRFINGMRDEDPDGDFVFPDCTIKVSNGEEPFVPDAQFWKRELSRISAAFQDNGVVEGESKDSVEAS